MCTRALHFESVVSALLSRMICRSERCCFYTFLADIDKRPTVHCCKPKNSHRQCVTPSCFGSHLLVGRQTPFTSPIRHYSALPTSDELSVGSSTIAVADLPPIPEPPLPVTDEQLEVINNIIGNNLDYLGLGNYTPSGIVQIMLCYIHGTLGVPWWQGIMICSETRRNATLSRTTLVRLSTVPVMLASQRNSALMGTMTKGMQHYNNKLLDAKRRKDTFQQQLIMLEMQEYMKEKGAMRLYMKTVGISFVQGAIFLTYFYALRGMSMAPVLSLTQGGFLWVTDLTLPDPTWILPAYSALTIAMILELGIETGISTASMSKFKWVMRLMPFGIFFFIKGFPSAMLLHWATSNTFSLVIAVLFQVPAIRTALKIPPLPAGSIFDKFKSVYQRIVSKKSAGNSETKKKERKSLRDQWRDFYDANFLVSGPSAKTIRENDARRFTNAGKFSPPPTFPYNPREKFSKEFEAGEESFFRYITKKRKNTK
ncbi:unnamed protein product [Soboliphyme baturini]|uniref:Mitochondrial inner membrane protein OXA1L n=1 Tax=Soboliphyme baturini TaxID=241478 RepID=A0A183IE60_9BILA|nr:unnamed protein product [Soboliphyme baturini]